MVVGEEKFRESPLRGDYFEFAPNLFGPIIQPSALTGASPPISCKYDTGSWLCFFCLVYLRISLQMNLVAASSCPP